MKRVVILLIIVFLMGCVDDRPDVPTPDNQIIENSAKEIYEKNKDNPFGIHSINVDADLLNDIGIKWFRPGLHPDPMKMVRMEKSESNYLNWIRDHEINVIDNIGVFKKDGSCVPSHPDYKEKLKEMIERYDGDGYRDIDGIIIKHWEIGNEVNYEHLGTGCYAEDYAETLKFIYPVIKEACEDCYIIYGASGPQGEDLYNYLDTVLKNGGGDYFDILDFHHFGNYDSYEGIKINYNNLKGVLRENGFDKEIIILETGTFSGETGKGIVQSEEQQAGDLVRRYVTGISLGAKKIFWAWGLYEGFGGTGNGFFDQTGLIYDGKGKADKGEGVKKKSYFTLKRLTSSLDGEKFVKEIPQNNQNVYLYEFTNGKFIAWYDYWKEKGLRGMKKIGFDKEVKITDLVTGEKSKGKEIIMGENPLFIEK